MDDMINRVRVVLLTALVLGVAVVVFISLFVERLAIINIGPRDDLLWWFPILGALFFLTPGFVILRRSNWHPVGWLLLGLAFGFPLSFGPDFTTIVELSTAQRWWLWLTTISLSAMFWSVWCALIVVFPGGISRRRGSHRALAYAVLGVNAISVALTAFQETLSIGDVTSIPNPLPFAAVPHLVGEVAALIPNLLVVPAVIDFIIRFRQAREPTRSQYRWVIWSFIFLVSSLVLAVIASAISGNALSPAWVLVVLAYLLVPVAFMVAILRYRLYDIDRVVSRTITYGAVAVAIAAAYAVPVIAIPRIFGESSTLVVAGSTLAAAAVFNPARRTIQRSVERRFNRAHFDADLQLDLFGQRLRFETDLVTIERQIGELIAGTIAPDQSSLWIRSDAPGWGPS